MANRATIVGAGLVGPLAACMLRQRGWQVALLEKRGDPRAAGYTGGKSINLALSHRGIRALEAVGLGQEILADAIPMRARCIHDRAGSTSHQRYSRHAHRHISAVSRGGLNCQLLDAAEAAGASVRFDVDISSIDVRQAALALADGETIDADMLIGADGGGSQVREAMVDAGVSRVTQSMLEHGYKELTIPSGPDGTWLLEGEVLHIWPQGRSMMIALPNPDGSFTCTLFWPHAGDGVSFDCADAATVGRAYPDAAALMPTLDVDWQANPVGQLGTIRCDTWSVNERTLLIGDAAHAIVPFFGQGMNAGFEDVRLLGDALDNGETLEQYAVARKPDADAIADLALHNFIEMRDHTASWGHVLRHTFAQWLDRLPGGLTPMYELVTFTDVPYSRTVRIVAHRRILLRTVVVVICLFLVLALLWMLQ